MDKFAERLRQLRIKDGRERCVLSELCGLNHNAIKRYEEKEAVPNITAVVRIADYFGVSVDYLLGRTDNLL